MIFSTTILNRIVATSMFVKAVIDNGFGNAILGTIIIVVIGAMLSIPTGIMTGIFLAEFGQTNLIGGFVRFISSILAGVPSIVVGVFAYGVIVLVTKGFSAIAGGFALAVIMLPVIILTTEESLKLIPTSQRLASAALGGTRFQTTFRIVISTAIPGITTGILLAVARAAGETAPLRLCIARALAVKPKVLLMDEPCSALDPIATMKVEELIHSLQSELTIAIVTHNMQQAARVSNFTAFFSTDESRIGQMVEFGPTEQIFNNPLDPRTRDYISGRFG